MSTWLVNRPGAHPWWEWWTVTVVCLRDVKGLPAATRSYPEAAYEFQILTLNPEEFPNPDPDMVNDGFTYLEPPDVIEQFHGITDGQAEQLCSFAIRAIVEGDISPDEDFQEEWRALVREKVNEIRDGKHTMN